MKFSLCISLWWSYENCGVGQYVPKFNVVACLHKFRQWFGAEQATSHYLNNDDSHGKLRCIYASPDFIELMNPLWPSDTIWQQIWVNIGSGNGLSPDGTKLLLKPVATYHQRSLLAFSCGQFQGNTHDILPWNAFENYWIEITATYISRNFYGNFDENHIFFLNWKNLRFLWKFRRKSRFFVFIDWKKMGIFIRNFDKSREGFFS